MGRCTGVSRCVLRQCLGHEGSSSVKENNSARYSFHSHTTSSQFTSPPIHPHPLLPPAPPTFSSALNTMGVMSPPSVLTATLTSTVLYLQTDTDTQKLQELKNHYFCKLPLPPSNGSVCPRRVDFRDLPQGYSGRLHQEVIDRYLVLTTRHIVHRLTDTGWEDTQTQTNVHLTHCILSHHRHHIRDQLIYSLEALVGLTRTHTHTHARTHTHTHTCTRQCQSQTSVVSFLFPNTQTHQSHSSLYNH